MKATLEEIERALEVLQLPKMVTKEDIKRQYRYLAKRYHPDVANGKGESMEKINHAYAVLMRYIEEFRYTFDEQEYAKQLPQEGHHEQFDT